MTIGRRRRAAALGLCAMLSLVACAESRRAPAPAAFTDISGAPVALSSLSGSPAVLVFWRSDCGPCLIELNQLAALEAAAAPARLVTIAVEDRQRAAAYLASIGNPSKVPWVVDGDLEAAILAFSEPPARLPLAVALDDEGNICARHQDILSLDLAKEWGRQC